MRTSRLVVFNYNQTGFLETMAMRIPSMLICDYRKKYPLRSVSLPLYQMLERVGICHVTPESAAAHINRVWDDIDGWWGSSNVQDATTRFCQAYCELEDGLTDRISEQLASAASTFV
jgi:putative transferase (TIGR04331 family)